LDGCLRSLATCVVLWPSRSSSPPPARRRRTPGAAGHAAGAGIGGQGAAGLAGQTAAGAGGTASAGNAGQGTAGLGGTTGKAGSGGAASAGTSSAGAAGSPSAGGGGAAAGSGGSPWQPDPLPSIGLEPPAPCAAATTGDYFQFLDDVCKAKKHPSVQDRDLACPIDDASPTVPLSGGGTATYVPAGAPVTFDTTALAGVVPASMKITLILVRRVKGVPHYRYLSNGTHDDAYQPWSTSKFMAIANAAATLRQKSAYKVGLTASVDGAPLGDYVTSVHNYDDNPYASNALASYFHDIGGRAKANGLVHGWLGRPAAETFGGNYGAASAPLGFSFVEGNGSAVTVAPDASPAVANNLSSHTAAEFLKRLAHHRENAGERLPDIQWADVKTLFYGAEGSTKYGPWGGMTADTTLYAQQYDMDYLEARSHGRWVTFSKLGLGTNGQFTTTSYACYPTLDPTGAPVPGAGRELAIATYLDQGGAGSGLAQQRDRDRLIAKAYRAVLVKVMDGSL
jgi:hypothetical protein